MDTMLASKKRAAILLVALAATMVGLAAYAATSIAPTAYWAHDKGTLSGCQTPVSTVSNVSNGASLTVNNLQDRAGSTMCLQFSYRNTGSQAVVFVEALLTVTDNTGAVVFHAAVVVNGNSTILPGKGVDGTAFWDTSSSSSPAATYYLKTAIFFDSQDIAESVNATSSIVLN